MIKRTKVLLILCGILLMTGCGAQEEDPYRVDTVVQIPVDPTDPPTEAPEATEAITEETASTEETKGSSAASGTKTSSGNKSSSSGSKSSSSGKSSGSSKSTKETQPAATEPPATESPATQPHTEAPTEPPYDPSGYSIGSLEYAILDAINAYREAEGLAALSTGTKLCGVAALRAMESRQLWSHSRPDGRNYTSALSDYGCGYSVSAENLVYATNPDAEAIAAKWMSADNRDSFLSDAYTTAGIGVYTCDGMTYIACILVG